MGGNPAYPMQTPGGISIHARTSPGYWGYVPPDDA